MKSSLENFRPKLRSGRVVPHGSRIIFETDSPFNQIILPMALADLILLCSGQFTVREIIEKIFKKQGTVPFRAILKTIHILHEGGFFENGAELELNANLRSWMERKRDYFSLSWRFGQRIVASNSYPVAFYAVTMGILVLSLFGLQELPSSPLQFISQWLNDESPLSVWLKIFVCSSLLQSGRHLLRGIQLLLLTGRAYNVSLRLSAWGAHLHVGDEAYHVFDSRLYGTMFHLSQILVGWFAIFTLSPLLPPDWSAPLMISAMVLTFWEINPFVRSEALSLVKNLLIRDDREGISWHFETSALIDSIRPASELRSQEFARICTFWGLIWLMGAVALLHESAIIFGPPILKRSMQLDWAAVFPVAGLLLWLTMLYFVVQTLVETVAVALVMPAWKKLKGSAQKFLRNPRTDWEPGQILEKIQDLPLFSHFHDQALNRIVEQSELLQFRANASIIRQGDPSREIYVLLEGQVQAVRTSADGKTEWLTELGSVSVFGEAALLEDSPRGAEIYAHTPIVVLKVPVRVVRQIAQETQVIRELDNFRNAILVNQFFASSPVFRSLSADSLQFLSSRGTLEYFDQGQNVFNQGDIGEALYLILRGSVTVTVNEQSMKTVYQGNFFGEIALIANIPRTGTARTNEPCVFFKLPFDAVWQVLVQNIDLGVFIETIAEGRLREDLDVSQSIKPSGTDSI